MPSISQIHTSCKNCVFAKYNDITQIDCELNYIQKYKDKQIEILEVYDIEKEFYVINNKKCLGYRENKWFEQYNLQDSSIDKKIEKFKESNYINYLLLIDLKNFDLSDLNELGKVIQQVSIKPTKIIFVRYQACKIFTYEIIKQFFEQTQINCKWRIQTMVDNSLENKHILHNVVNLNKGYRFILSINNKTNDIESLINNANKIVYEDLESFIAIKNKDGSSILFSAPSYRWSMVVEKKNILDDEKNYIVI